MDSKVIIDSSNLKVIEYEDTKVQKYIGQPLYFIDNTWYEEKQ